MPAYMTTTRSQTSTTEQQETRVRDMSIQATVSETATDSTETIIIETVTTTLYSQPDTSGRQYVTATTYTERETVRQNRIKTDMQHHETETSADSLSSYLTIQDTTYQRDSTTAVTGSTRTEGRTAYDRFMAWGFWLMLALYILLIAGAILWICIKTR